MTGDSNGKVDFKKSLDAYRAQRGRSRIIDVPDMRCLMTDGHGDPNTSPALADAIAALYPVAYRLKFASKRDLGRDYVVPPLEGLWWARQPTRLDDVRFQTLREGRCVQTLHVGSFDDEAAVLTQLHHAFIPSKGLRMAGRHHEIHLSDFRRTAPEKQRTILRQPVTAKAQTAARPGGVTRRGG
ncbi:GyrI-like domain-containing protein [Micromonospora sp. NPDC005979]|uniref:GyrI-like domain-containing protein n=1 Tax=Micromonospora sp. NPDC005979 TaxID=3156726 RepID=UPI0033B5200D